jgi:6-phosphogluconolactonase
VNLPNAEIVICRDREALVQQAADLARAPSEHAIAERGRAAVATSCGDISRRVIESLVRSALLRRDIHIFGANECWRPKRNGASAEDGACDWLVDLPIPIQNVHAAPLGFMGPNSAASAFEQQVRAFFGVGVGELPRFDVVLLQLGEDAHAASLFPFSSSLDETARLAVANYVARARQPVRDVHCAAHQSGAQGRAARFGRRGCARAA